MYTNVLEDIGTERGDNGNFFVPKYKDSINVKISESNPYDKKDKETDTPNGPAPSAIEYMNYQINANVLKCSS